MADRLRRLLDWLLNEYVKTTVVGVIITVLSLTTVANLPAISEWLDSRIRLWVGIVFITYGSAVSVVAILMWRDLRSTRMERTGILWQPHKDLLFKVMLQRKGSRLDVRHITGPYCRNCRTEVDTLLNVYPDGTRGGYTVFCPGCDDLVKDKVDSEEVLKRMAGAIAEGRINRGELTPESSSIEW